MILPDTPLSRTADDLAARQVGLPEPFDPAEDDPEDPEDQTTRAVTATATATRSSAGPDDGRISATATSARETTARTTQRTTVIRSSAASSSRSSSSQSTFPTPSRQVITSTIIARPSVDLDPIVLTTFGTDFPVPTQGKATDNKPGRGYVFLEKSLIGDSMLLFVVFCAAFFVFTLCLIKLTRFSERRRGVVKTDQMLGEDMRWQEGREVIEKRIIYREHTPAIPSRPADARLARRQSWGNKR